MATDLPEERLLRLIKSKPGKTSALKREEARGKSDNTVLFLTGNSLFRTKGFKPLAYIAYANRALVLLLVIFTGYLIFSFSIPYEKRYGIQPASGTPAQPLGPGRPAQAAARELKDYSAYSQNIGSKKLFLSDGASPSDEVIQSSGLSDRFSLVGIIAGENPQAVIEDKKEGKTYYLYKGGLFNGTRVQEIEEGKVILDSRGERISLVL